MILRRNRYWSALPPLTLRGVGTGLVESLMTYVLRLSYASGLPVPSIRGQISKMIGQPSTFSADESGFDATVHALEVLSGTDGLAHGSLRWASAVVRQRSVSSEGRRRKWCPLCYLEWDEDSWEPLVWSMDLIDRCPVHKCALERECSFCGAEQLIGTPYAHRRGCRKCNEPLGHRIGASSPTHYRRWVEQQVLDLVELCATPGRAPLAADAFRSYLRALEQTARTMPTVPIGLRDAFCKWKINSQQMRRVELRTLINLCSLQAVSLSRALLDPIGSASAPLLDLWESFASLPLSYGPQRTKAHAFDIAIRRLLRNSDGRCLPAMQELLHATRLTCHQAKDLRPESYLRYQVAYLSQGESSRQTHARRSLRVALQLLSQREPRKIGGHPRIRDYATSIAQGANVAIELAVIALKTARDVRDILNEARLVLSRGDSPALDDPRWTRGFSSSED